MKPLDDLLLLWKDGTIGPEDLADLKKRLTDPSARKQLVRSFVMDAVIMEALCVESAGRKGDVRKTVFGIHWGRWIAIAASLVIIVGSVLFVHRRANQGSERTRAILAMTVPGAVVERGGKEIAAAVNMPLRAGDLVETKGGAGPERLKIAYADEETGILVGVNTRFRLLDESHGKQYRLEIGKIEVEAAKQPAGHPMKLFTPNAVAEAVGTKFILSVSGDARPAADNVSGAQGGSRDAGDDGRISCLSVLEGHVRFTREGGGSGIEVAASERAIVEGKNVPRKMLDCTWVFRNGPDPEWNALKGSSWHWEKDKDGVGWMVADEVSARFPDTVAGSLMPGALPAHPFVVTITGRVDKRIAGGLFGVDMVCIGEVVKKSWRNPRISSDTLPSRFVYRFFCVGDLRMVQVGTDVSSMTEYRPTSPIGPCVIQIINSSVSEVSIRELDPEEVVDVTTRLRAKLAEIDAPDFSQP